MRFSTFSIRTIMEFLYHWRKVIKCNQFSKLRYCNVSKYCKTILPCFCKTQIHVNTFAEWYQQIFEKNCKKNDIGQTQNCHSRYSKVLCKSQRHTLYQPIRDRHVCFTWFSWQDKQPPLTNAAHQGYGHYVWIHNLLNLYDCIFEIYSKFPCVAGSSWTTIKESLQAQISHNG